MLVNQPDSGEQAFDIMEAMCYSNAFGLIIVDSAAALVPLAEVENGMDYNPIGLQARMLSKGLRKLKGLAYKHNVTFIFINQLREKPGAQGTVIEVTPGGRALKFYASIRMDVRAKKIEKSGTFVGNATTVKFVKNKVAPPFTNAEYDYYWHGGVDRIKNIMDVAIDTEVISRAGAYYFYGEESKNPYTDGAGNQLKWQGKENLLDALRNSPALFEYTNSIVQGKIPKDTQFVSESDDDPAEESELQLELA
jgi:recombination protein RecA